MLKKIALLTISSIFLNITAMEQCQQNNSLQPWVAQASQIRVRTIIKNGIRVVINEHSTIADVKQSLQDTEGIPPAQQSLRACWANWKTLWLSDTFGDVLSDDANVKQLMNIHNTDRLLLTLTLARLSADQ